ncbi:hypothetical protein NDU88_005462, partial [Pleurodeles waltl]
ESLWSIYGHRQNTGRGEINVRTSSDEAVEYLSWLGWCHFVRHVFRRTARASWGSVSQRVPPEAAPGRVHVAQVRP